MTVLTLFLTFAVCLVLGIPFVVALGLASALALLTLSMASVVPLAQSTVTAIDSFSLVSIPLFLLMGNLMTEGGLTTRLMALANVFVGRFRGGLAMANVLAGLFFAGISGSAVADLVAMGGIIIPAMKKQGYTGAFSAAITEGAALLGPIIPPSILMILYGIQAGVSVTKLFVAGIIPGLLIGAGLLAYVAVLARRRNYPTYAAPTAREALRAVGRAAPSVLTPVIIVLGVIHGVFTVSESASIAVVWAALLTLVIYRTVDWKILKLVLWRSTSDTAVVMILVAISSVTAWIMAIDRVPDKVVGLLLGLGIGKVGVLLCLNALLGALGMFIAPAAALLLVVPVLVPLGRAFGIDPVHLGIVVVVNLNFGLLTPPVAIANLIGSRIAGVALKELHREVWPVLGVHVAVVLLVTYIPWLTLALPARILGP